MKYITLFCRCLITGVAFFWLFTSVMPLAAQEAPVTGTGLTKAGRLTQSYTWYEGERRKTVWLNPGLIAEFPAAATQQSPIPGLYARAVLIRSPGSHIRLWRLPEGLDPASVLRNLNSQGVQSAKYSPVLHDAPGPTARMRALPGNIIVYFNPAWDRQAISQWVTAHGLRVVRRLAIGPRAYVLDTGPGLEALDLANTLYETGDVVAAFPDWWQEAVTR